MTAQNPNALSVFYLGKQSFAQSQLEHPGMYFGQKKSTCKTEERRCKSLVVLLKYSMSLKLDSSRALTLVLWSGKVNLLSGGESKPLPHS